MKHYSTVGVSFWSGPNHTISTITHGNRTILLIRPPRTLFYGWGLISKWSQLAHQLYHPGTVYYCSSDPVEQDSTVATPFWRSHNISTSTISSGNRTLLFVKPCGTLFYGCDLISEWSIACQQYPTGTVYSCSSDPEERYSTVGTPIQSDKLHVNYIGQGPYNIAYRTPRSPILRSLSHLESILFLGFHPIDVATEHYCLLDPKEPDSTVIVSFGVNPNFNFSS